MIIIRSLSKSFGRFKAVSDLNFTVECGQALALWGANGAGKTTVIRCLLGLIRFQGQITIAGIDVRRNPKQARRLLGYVPQELALHDDLTVIGALHFYARLKKAGADRPGAVLAQVGLADHGYKRVRELSGGMKQRLALAIALLADPPLLVLDELMANLDADARHGFLDLLVDLKRRGKTILFTSHRVDEVEKLADDVLLLQQGKLQLRCAADELAGSIGLRTVLKIFVGDKEVDAGESAASRILISNAVDVLRQRGFTASPNGVGLHVEVDGCHKALPIRALTEAAIRVRDFEFVSQSNTTTPGTGESHAG